VGQHGLQRETLASSHDLLVQAFELRTSGSVERFVRAALELLPNRLVHVWELWTKHGPPGVSNPSLSAFARPWDIDMEHDLVPTRIRMCGCANAQRSPRSIAP
jgi:hypothetical protein